MGNISSAYGEIEPQDRAARCHSWAQGWFRQPRARQRHDHERSGRLDIQNRSPNLLGLTTGWSLSQKKDGLFEQHHPIQSVLAPCIQGVEIDPGCHRLPPLIPAVPTNLMTTGGEVLRIGKNTDPPTPDIQDPQGDIRGLGQFEGDIRCRVERVGSRREGHEVRRVVRRRDDLGADRDRGPVGEINVLADIFAQDGAVTA